MKRAELLCGFHGKQYAGWIAEVPHAKRDTFKHSTGCCPSCVAHWHTVQSGIVLLMSLTLKEQKWPTFSKLAQHTTPIAKTHRTATLFASEPTENLKIFINIHHRNITIPSRKHHRSITTHHWDTKASPTQSRDITNTKPRHHPHITKTSQRNHYTSPRHARDITDTSLKDHQNITSTCRKHHDRSPKNHWNISDISPNRPWNTNKT